MRTDLACAACMIDDLRGALDDAVDDESLRCSVLREALGWLGQALDGERIPSFYITRLHRLLKARAGQAMPFRALRERCNAAGFGLAPRVEARAAALTDDLQRLRLLVRWAIAGNHLDFRTVGTGYDLAPERIEAALQQVLDEGLAVDHTPALLALVRQAPRVTYLADNVGEIALDALLVAELQRYGCQVTIAVKGGPITSDATLDDARAVGLDLLAPLIPSGPDTLGIPLDEEMSPELRAALSRSGLVIAKGQANYYALSELAPGLHARSACLLRTKCAVVAAALGLAEPRANVAALLPDHASKASAGGTAHECLSGATEQTRCILRPITERVASMDWASGYVPANGIRIHYHRTGREKPPLVLLHGITDNGLCWVRLARALEAHCDLIMVDARGHGHSEAPETGYAPEDHAADVAGLIEGLGLGRPVLIGHSMGAATAAETAARYPERVGGVVLEDPPWMEMPAMSEEARAAYVAEWRAGIVANSSKTVEELVAHCRRESPTWDEAEWVPWAESKRQVSPQVVEIIAGLRASWQEVARRITCPALLVTGDPERGALVTPQIAQGAAGLLQNGTVVHIPGAGHNIRREQFEAYVGAVRQFLWGIA
jgi:uncharacterized protein with ATP-grasp and redox domains/pimeloyl-ACP methyl ester carboxylesterase